MDTSEIPASSDIESAQNFVEIVDKLGEFSKQMNRERDFYVNEHTRLEHSSNYYPFNPETIALVGLEISLLARTIGRGAVLVPLTLYRRHQFGKATGIKSAYYQEAEAIIARNAK